MMTINWHPRRAYLAKLILIVGDVLAVALAALLGRMANWAYDQNSWTEAFVSWWSEPQALIRLPLLAGLSGLMIAWFWLQGHYSKRLPFWDETKQILRVVLLLAVIDSMLMFLGKWSFSRLWLVGTWAMLLVLLPLLRVRMKRWLLRMGIWQLPTVILGTGDNAREAYAALNSEPLMGIDVVAFMSPQTTAEKDDDLPVPVVPLGNDPMQVIRAMRPPHIVVALNAGELYAQQKLLQELSLHDADLNVIPSIRGLPLLGMEMTHFFSHETLMLSVRNNLARPIHRLVKRVFDVVVAGLALLALSPVFAWLSWRIWREDGAPVFFRQERVGRDGTRFVCYKFRTMVKDAEARLAAWEKENPQLMAEYRANNFKLKDDPRVLPVGKWIRRYSLDELPQLLNVMKGEMSLVGPRPLLARELGDYGDALPFYQEARPGITGLWQISGRSDTTFLTRANLDTWYVRNWSLWYDVVILIRTVKVVFGREGAY